MSDESFLRVYPGPVWEGDEEPCAIVQRLFVLAAHRVGSAAALGRHLGLGYAEVRPYLTGKAVPPRKLLLRTVDLVSAELNVLRSGFSEQAWCFLSLPAPQVIKES